VEESLRVAKLLEKEGVHGLVLSGGFVSRAPMYVMRGSMPVSVMAKYMTNPWMKFGTKYFGRLLMKEEPFSEAYFLEDALKFRKALNIPLIYVGGLKSGEMIEHVLSQGFEFVQIARALIHDPGFIGKIKQGLLTESGCQHANYCIARMYSGKMVCFQHTTEGPGELGIESDKKGP
jgi:2,4-dienoyl-CoA reductase-like NADH-dependent reductase (Old Yellow Enzyme family)